MRQQRAKAHGWLVRKIIFIQPQDTELELVRPTLVAKPFVGKAAWA